MVAAMRLVTGSTVFGNRCVLEYKGTSFFRMALVTKIGGRIRFYHFRTKPSMRVMAVGTFNFALLDGVLCLFV